MTIVALDPGGSTGVAWGTGKIIQTRQFTEPKHHKELYYWLVDKNPRVLIVENFKWTSTPSTLIAVEYIGVCEMYAQSRRDLKVVRQDRTCKGFWSNEKLQTIELYKKGQPHAMDALRHMLYFLTFTANDQSFVQRLRVSQQLHS